MQVSATPDLDEIVGDYCKAWSEADPARRQQLLDRVWDDDGSYTDPTAQIVGRQRLLEHIAQFHAQFPGSQVIPSSLVDAHHDKLRFSWRLVLPDGQVPLEGIDFGELSPNGKLQRITGFFGSLAAA